MSMGGEREKMIDCVVFFKSIYMLLARNGSAAALYKRLNIVRWYENYDMKCKVSARDVSDECEMP